MTDFFKRDTGWKLWKLAIWKLCNNCIVTAIGVYIASTTSVKWSSLSWDERTVILLGAVLAIGKTLDSFFDQTAAQIKQQQADAAKAGPFPVP